MIACSDAFKSAIKADPNEIKVRVVLGYNTPLTLEDSKIQSISITSKADIALGGVQNDDLTLTLMENAITDDQFNQEIDIEILIGCVIGETTEYISIGTYEADGWGKNDKTGIVTINLTNKINSNASIPQNIVATAGTDIRDYASSLISSVFGKALSVNASVTSQILGKSWLYYNDIVEQLKAFGSACNGLFRHVNSFELVPYKATNSADTLKVGPNESILEIGRVSDYSKTKANIEILKSQFIEGTIDKLASCNIRIVNGEGETVNLGTGCPTSVSHVVIGNVYGQLGKITTGIVDCSVYIDGVYSDSNRNVPVNIFGKKVESSLKDKKTVTDGTVTYIENPYIQTEAHVSALSKAIYEGVRYKVKYRGNPTYQVGDTLTVDGLGNLLIYSHKLTYNGGLTGYLEGVLVDEVVPPVPVEPVLLVPNLASANDQGYIVSQSSIADSRYYGWQSFNLTMGMSTAGGFWAAGTTTNAWLQIQLPSAKTVTKIAITSRNDYSNQNLKDFTLQGSNNGTTWADIASQDNLPAWGNAERREYTINNTIAYNYYRLFIKNSVSGGVICVGKLELWGC